ncbi:MAG: D-tyrosyl-tRNA(Tyr) deacylase [Gammaproteobacteria bacterium]|nr:D-tyrosyl-tRNA(Tyr) deacylase [Gammaproteobacteria bacterium]
MIALLQRVRHAKVEVAGEVVGQIDSGTLALIGVQPDDTQAKADKLLHKILGYRMFSDPEGKMNLSLRDTEGGLLLVSQFTLAADTRSGMRAGFSTAAPPALANELFDYLVAQARAGHPVVQTGQFAADMQVSLQNDGPVTFWLEV